MIESRCLSGKGIFSRFEEAEVVELCRLLDEKRFAAGEHMWPVDSVDNDLFFIIEGKVELSCATEFAERRAVMGMMGPGSLVGEASFFGGDSCYVSAMAVSELSVGALSRVKLEELAQTSPKLYEKLLNVILMLLSRRLVQAYNRLASIF